MSEIGKGEKGETMDRKTRRRVRLMRLCHKYGYDETASILKRRIERARRAQLAQGTPILQNLSQQEDVSR